MKNKSYAQTYQYGFGTGQIDIEVYAIRKDKDSKNKRTIYIFKDGSALWIDHQRTVGVINNYDENVRH